MTHVRDMFVVCLLYASILPPSTIDRASGLLENDLLSNVVFSTNF